jgi:selenophosphate synthase
MEVKFETVKPDGYVPKVLTITLETQQEEKMLANMFSLNVSIPQILNRENLIEDSEVKKMTDLMGKICSHLQRGPK